MNADNPRIDTQIQIMMIKCKVLTKDYALRSHYVGQIRFNVSWLLNPFSLLTYSQVSFNCFSLGSLKGLWIHLKKWHPSTHLVWFWFKWNNWKYYNQNFNLISIRTFNQLISSYKFCPTVKTEIKYTTRQTIYL